MPDEVYSPVRVQDPSEVPLPELPPLEVEYMVMGLSRSISGHLEWTPYCVRTAGLDDARGLVEEGLDAAQDPLALWQDFKVVRATTKCEYINIETGEPG